MPQKRINITRGQASRVRQLERELGDETLRTLLTGSNNRMMRRERLENLKAGTAKIQPWEAERIAAVQKNKGSIGKLKSDFEDRGILHGSRKNPLTESYKNRLGNKALRTWMIRGKQSDLPYDMQPIKVQRQQHKAIRALYFLGVEPNDSAAYTYVRKD